MKFKSFVSLLQIKNFFTSVSTDCLESILADVFITLAASAHVFTAIVSMILLVLMFGESLWGGSAKRMKLYGLGLIIFSALTYILAGW